MKKHALFFVLFLTFILFIVLYFVLNKSDITVIVRSVGENSEEVCVKSLENIFSKRNVFLIKNITPLSSATKKSFELALKRNKKWTLLVDADTIVDGDKIKLFISKADEIIKNDPKAFVFQGLLFDKFPQCYRQSGVWLYKTENLANLLKYNSKCSSMLKPDDCMVMSFKNEGYNTYGIDCVIGIHDFFQSPRSIVKKYFIRCAKYPDRILVWQERWNSLAKSDKDFLWAIRGVELYKKNKKKIQNNSCLIDEILKDNNINLPDKVGIDENKINSLIEKYVKNNTIDNNGIKYYRSRLHKNEFI